MTAYENLGITNFYLGRIDKSKYYLDRMIGGKSEAMFSSVKKISLTHTRRKYKHFKFQPFRAEINAGGGTTKTGAIDHNKVEKNQKDLLSVGV